MESSNSKWNEIERNLAEQESFVQSIMAKNDPSRHRLDPNDGNAGDPENILSTSIQKAKDKISSLEAKTSHQRLNTSH